MMMVLSGHVICAAMASNQEKKRILINKFTGWLKYGHVVGMWRRESQAGRQVLVRGSWEVSMMV